MLLTLEEVAKRDELLGPVADQATLDEAVESLVALALECGVEEARITSTPWVKRYVSAYTFWRTAVTKSYSAGGSSYSGGEDIDAYARKIPFYAAELKELKATITEKALTGSTTGSGGFRAVKLYRG